MNLSGHILGDYKLESVIGRGPRATVYRARHIRDKRLVAVKVYDDSVDPDTIRHAAEAAQTLTYAHVLPVDDFGVYRGLAFVVMRYMPIGSLQSRRRGATPLPDIQRILPQIASALEHARAHGLLALNLKPANLLLDHPGNAFIADFGIPPAPDSPFSAPEVNGRGGQVDARADVYSLGGVLYLMLTGRSPTLRRPRDDSANTRMANLPSPRSLRAGIPPGIEAVVLRALSIDPESRYATPDALAQAFAEAASSEPAQAAPSPRLPWARWAAFGLVGLAIVVGAIIAASGPGAPAAVATPSPTLAVTEPASGTTPSPAAAFTDTPTPTRTRTRPASPAPRTRTPAPTATASATPALPVASLPSLTPVSAFTVVSLTLKPPPARVERVDRLELLFDATVQSSTGGPFGQLFAYLPIIDSLVTTRIGAQVTSGEQVLSLTLIVDCLQAPEPVTTDRIFLEIRPTDRGPTLYATAIPYLKTWCR
ncbi:MAG TPA: protein kinase [Anaerolineae bacterium]|nr:protein kinase [Anaerolineae bacterium]